MLPNVTSDVQRLAELSGLSSGTPNPKLPDNLITDGIDSVRAECRQKVSCDFGNAPAACSSQELLALLAADFLMELEQAISQ